MYAATYVVQNMNEINTDTMSFQTFWEIETNLRERLGVFVLVIFIKFCV